jgi:hypothetical protein
MEKVKDETANHQLEDENE